MAYQKKTKHYSLPYLSDGEKLEGAWEERAMKMIDNALFAGNLGVARALFDDGTYKLKKDGDKKYSLSIIPCANYSVIGIVHYRLFYYEDILEFPNIYNGHKYYIYISYSSELDVDPTKFLKTVSMDKKPDIDNNVLLAEIDLTGSEPIINEMPDSKVYADEIFAHTKDQNNPHGRTLYQDKLKITDALMVKESIIYKTVYVEGTFAGNGLCWRKTFDSTPVFVTIMQLEQGAGEIWVNIDSVINEVLIYNSGQSTKFKAEIKLE